MKLTFQEDAAGMREEVAVGEEFGDGETVGLQVT